jgi:hypothetical protein
MMLLPSYWQVPPVHSRLPQHWSDDVQEVPS